MKKLPYGMTGTASYIVQNAVTKLKGMLRQMTKKRKPFTYKTIKKKDGRKEVIETSEFEVTTYYFDADGNLTAQITVQE